MRYNCEKHIKNIAIQYLKKKGRRNNTAYKKAVNKRIRYFRNLKTVV